MHWKIIGISAVMAGLTMGCSSSDHARNSRYDRDDSYYSYNDRTVTYSDTGWRSIKTGLSKRQVLDRFGSPSEKRHFRNGTDTWYYSDGSRINFSRHGRVSSWKEPTYVSYRTETTHTIR